MRATIARKCPECTAGIMRGISWVGLDFRTQEWVHAECFKIRLQRYEDESVS